MVGVDLTVDGVAVHEGVAVSPDAFVVLDDALEQVLADLACFRCGDVVVHDDDERCAGFGRTLHFGDADDAVADGLHLPERLRVEDSSAVVVLLASLLRWLLDGDQVDGTELVALESARTTGQLSS